MTIFRSFGFRLIVALLAILGLNLLVLFTLPPTTTVGIVIKDAVSLIFGAFAYVLLIRRYDD